MNPIIMMNRNNLFFTANYAFPHNCNISDSVSDVNRKWSGGIHMLYFLASMSVGLRNLPTNETVTRLALAPSAPHYMMDLLGIEPKPAVAVHQTTGRRNRTVIVYHFRSMCRSEESNLVRHTFLRPSSPAKLVLPRGIEPLTSAFEARHSVL